MTRVARAAVGILLVVGVGIVAVCNGQSKPPAGGAHYDTQVEFSVTREDISVSRPVAVVSIKEQAANPFQWIVKGLPSDTYLEIDFHVQDGRKGPFDVPVPEIRGRYTFDKPTTIKAGSLPGKWPGFWKYDVVLREQKTNREIRAIDPAIIIMD